MKDILSYDQCIYVIFKFSKSYKFGSSIFFSSYLRFYARQVLASKNNVETAKTFTSLIYRAATSIPTKLECPYSWNHHWFNYTHVNTVLSLYLNSLPKELLLTEYEKLVTFMPNNVQLILR